MRSSLSFIAKTICIGLTVPASVLARVSNSVTTKAGTLEGGSCPNSTASFFLNVPFAEPPVGHRRFASPKAFIGHYSSNPRDASTPGPACIQFGTSFLETGAVSEDWKVVLFGQSAGATNAFIVSTLPQAKSLISAVIVESGGGRDIATSDVAFGVGASYLSVLSCSDVACMRTKTTAELNATEPGLAGTIAYSKVNSQLLRPYIDGRVIPRQPSAVGAQVPAIYGSNSNEGTIFVLGQYLTYNINSTQYTTFLTENFGPAAPLVEKYYSIEAFTTPSDPIPVFTAMSTIITDVSYFCPAYRALNLAVENGIPAYTYLFSHSPSCLWFRDLFPVQALPLIRAGHTAEIPFVFGNLENLPLPNGSCGFDEDERSISEVLVQAWTAMAEKWNPSTGGLKLPLWNQSLNLGVNVLDGVSVGVVNYTVCEFWDEIEKILSFGEGESC